MAHGNQSVTAENRKINSMVRWILAFIAMSFAWIVTPFTIFDRTFSPIDFDVKNADSFASLERVVYRYDFVKQGIAKPACPGVDCPLDPAESAQQLRYERTVQNIFLKTITAEGWRGTMYIRWDTSVPGFIKNQGEELSFDFYGLVGKSWRFFVNGVEISNGRGAATIDAIKFSSPGPAGTPLILGFEIDVGRSLSPGVTISAQPFLSRPDVALYLRQAYVGRDKEALIPISIGPTVLALLAAISCFLTPFYREILAFAFWVSFINWRFLLLNNLVPFPSFIQVDFVTFEAMLDAAILAAHWGFLGLFFRVKTNLKWLPVAAYIAMIPVLWIGGRFGVAIESILWMQQTFELQTSIGYLAGSVMGFHAWRATRRLQWAHFRRAVSFVVAVMSLGVAAAYAVSVMVIPNINSHENMVAADVIFQFIKYGPRGFVLLVGFLIALEWAIIVRDRQNVLQRFGRIVDPRLVNDIIRGPEKESKVIPHAVIFFVDIRGFTTICEVYSPDRVIRALNEYLDVVTTAVQRNGGVVDKFVGDAVMAIWGVPESGVDDSFSAIKAAIEIRKSIALLNSTRETSGEFGIDVGIGIHSGPTIFGAMGNGVRVDHTVIGPTINIASRLENMTKDLHCDIVISHSVLEKVEERVLVEDVGQVSIRGMTAQVGLAKLIGVQISESEFVIGNDALESMVSMRRPGRVVGSPGFLVVRNYRDDKKAPSSTETAA